MEKTTAISREPFNMSYMQVMLACCHASHKIVLACCGRQNIHNDLMFLNEEKICLKMV